jgi:diphthamide biosynthesis protein 2
MAHETHQPAPPILSTPDTHVFEASVPITISSDNSKTSDEDFWKQYEIQRTVDEISRAGWVRVALQFPDAMLPDAIRVYEALQKTLNTKQSEASPGEVREVRLFILGDTSYGACCVDEIAAEHVDAQVVVHYGRTCLSPTARLPVVYVYTTKKLDVQKMLDAFEETYKDKTAKVILVADGPYVVHQRAIMDGLKTRGFITVFETELVRDGESQIPNRTVPEEVKDDKDKLRDWSLFHIGQPPTALLLTLASRVASVLVYANQEVAVKAVEVSSKVALRRRYALVTSLSTCSVYGILINTLSVKNYLHIVERVKAQIAAAGKKHYTFVVGKVNSAKIANFSEVGGWVVIGCWESSLVESGDFYVPLITPFELQLALQADGKRVWTGEWMSDFEAVLRIAEEAAVEAEEGEEENTSGTTHATEANQEHNNYDSEEESAPPEFDLRTGRYISHSRPMRSSAQLKQPDKAEVSTNKAAPATGALVARPKGDVARVGGILSPGAEYLRSQRTWQGLGSDFELEMDFTALGALVEEGRSGHASGYTVGEEEDQVKH